MTQVYKPRSHPPSPAKSDSSKKVKHLSTRAKLGRNNLGFSQSYCVALSSYELLPTVLLQVIFCTCILSVCDKLSILKCAISANVYCAVLLDKSLRGSHLRLSQWLSSRTLKQPYTVANPSHFILLNSSRSEPHDESPIANRIQIQMQSNGRNDLPNCSHNS